MKPEVLTLWLCALVVAFALAASAGSVRADRFEPLRNDPRVENGLLMIAIGRHIELTCPTIERRRLAAGAFLLGLANHAMSLGFTRQEVSDYVEDDTERARVIEIAKRYLAERGVTSLQDVEGACRVGRDEISAASPIGRLLREE